MEMEFEMQLNGGGKMEVVEGGTENRQNMFFWGGLCHVAGKCVCLFKEKQ